MIIIILVYCTKQKLRHRVRWRSGNTLDSKLRGPEFKSRSQPTELGFFFMASLSHQGKCFTFPYSSKKSSSQHFINMPHPYKYTHSHSQTNTHTGTCIKSVNMFCWGIFGALWKGRGGGQELSAEVIRAPGWGSWYPPFRSVFLL